MKTQIKTASLDKAVEACKNLSSTEGTAYVIQDLRTNVFYVESTPGMVRNFKKNC